MEVPLALEWSAAVDWTVVQKGNLVYSSLPNHTASEQDKASIEPGLLCKTAFHSATPHLSSQVLSSNESLLPAPANSTQMLAKAFSKHDVLICFGVTISAGLGKCSCGSPH